VHEDHPDQIPRDLERRPGVELTRKNHHLSVRHFYCTHTLMNSELEKLYKLIDELDTAMLTTRRRDGYLVSRAMANQKRAPGADLWFVTSDTSGKLDDLGHDPHVNLAYYKDRTREWISVAGLARVSRDRSVIQQLYAPDWKAWFAEDGDPHHGTPDDPRIVLIGVDVHSAVFLEVNKPQPIVLFEIAKGLITSTKPNIGELHKVETGSS
jgi:general stress protein 26